MRKYFKINWHYALGEIILIFIAINTAIWFNNWNESRKQGTEEKLILQSIYEDIQSDTIDLNFNIKGYEVVAQADSIIARGLSTKSTCDSLFKLKFRQQLANFNITFHNSGYQVLKTKGLSLVQNQELRKNIIRLYDFYYTNANISLSVVKVQF